MNYTKEDLLNKLVAEGMRMRFGSHPSKWVKLRAVAELRRIHMEGYVDYYLTAFWIFRFQAFGAGIAYWGRGAMNSSLVCYCLHLTEVDPIRYALHAERFVNEEPPKFQFDVEESRYAEFMKIVEEQLAANAEEYDVEVIREHLLEDITPVAYLSRRKESELPQNTDDEMVRYALTFPGMETLYGQYVQRCKAGLCGVTGIDKLDAILAPTKGLLVFQEQMMDILKQVFGIHGTLSNDIRRAIQRGERLRMEDWKHEMRLPETISSEEAEKAWQVLTSNPRAALKAHALSRLMATCRFNGIKLYNEPECSKSAGKVSKVLIALFMGMFITLSVACGPFASGSSGSKESVMRMSYYEKQALLERAFWESPFKDGGYGNNPKYIPSKSKTYLYCSLGVDCYLLQYNMETGELSLAIPYMDELYEGEPVPKYYSVFENHLVGTRLYCLCATGQCGLGLQSVAIEYLDLDTDTWHFITYGTENTYMVGDSIKATVATVTKQGENGFDTEWVDTVVWIKME